MAGRILDQGSNENNLFVITWVRLNVTSFPTWAGTSLEELGQHWCWWQMNILISRLHTPFPFLLNQKGRTDEPFFVPRFWQNISYRLEIVIGVDLGDLLYASLYRFIAHLRRWIASEINLGVKPNCVIWNCHVTLHPLFITNLLLHLCCQLLPICCQRVWGIHPCKPLYPSLLCCHWWPTFSKYQLYEIFTYLDFFIFNFNWFYVDLAKLW